MRVTRSMTSSEDRQHNQVPRQTVLVSKRRAPTRNNRAIKNKDGVVKPRPASAKTAFTVSQLRSAPDQKRKGATSTIQQLDINTLPHNLGQSVVKDSPDSLQELDTISLFPQKRIKAEHNIEPDVVVAATPQSKRKKDAAKYGLTPGISPFPEFPRPSPEDCEEVNKLLSSVHGEVKVPTKIPQPSLTVTGCGEVPSVLDALIRTVLSGATTGSNSARAFKGIVDKFGILTSGIGKGSVNWNAVRNAPIKEVFEAMKSGGLATTKSKYIKEILRMVYEENLDRKEVYQAAQDETGKSPLAGAENESHAQREVEIALTDENVLSLDWIHALDKEQAMLELIKYPGIGPKTAACVILFCLQRPCFAVDTHIFRICKWLDWLPSNGKRVSEITAFSHLEVRIPDHLKYSLHQLLIRHGKSCPRCRAITGEKSEGWDKGCIIDHLVRRTGKRKANNY